MSSGVPLALEPPIPLYLADRGYRGDAPLRLVALAPMKKLVKQKQMPEKSE